MCIVDVQVVKFVGYIYTLFLVITTYFKQQPKSHE